MNKSLAILLLSSALLLGSAYPTLAHVTINPKEVSLGYQILSIRVPNESKVATTEVHIFVPDEVDVFTIKQTPGWTAKIIRLPAGSAKEEMHHDDGNHMDMEEGKISEIIYYGRLDPGQYQDFSLNTHLETDKDSVSWKVVQKYANGKISNWDDNTPEYPGAKLTLIPINTTSNSITESKATQNKTELLAKISLVASFLALIVNLKKK